MFFPIPLFLCFIYILWVVFGLDVEFSHEQRGKEFLKILNEKSARIASKLVKAQWDFETQHNENTNKQFLQATSDAINNIKLDFDNVVNNYPWWSFNDPDMQRQFKIYSDIGILALPSKDYRKVQEIISNVDKVRRDNTICDFYNKTKCNLHLQPDIQDKLSSSENAEELFYLSLEWKKATKNKLSKLLNDCLELYNKTAIFNNYTNFREYSLRQINLSNPSNNMIALWETVKPLYYQIHAYVRSKLRDTYGEKIVPRRGSIPVYLLGNIWYENWSGIANKILPFPELENLNFTAVMIEKGLTPEKIHQFAESFFVSMNFSIPSALWFSDSLDVHEIKNTEKCHPKLFNFFNKNIRIKDCGTVSMNDMLADNSLLFKAQYVIQYSHLPFVYQKPADPGLEKALNDIIVMCSSTFSTLKKFGLYEDEINEKVRLNRLFKLALEKVVAIPFLLVQEFWRWEIYKGTPIEDTTNFLSKLREKYLGISSFTKELNFDPGGIGSVFSMFSLSHYFFSYFLEFQIYDILCNKSKAVVGFYENFDECNLYGSTEAGNTLRNLMSLGSSKILEETLSLSMGIKNITSDSLLKYFEPLFQWLTEENKKNKEFIGWYNSNFLKKVNEKRRRRKRSLERYPLETNDDIDNEDMYINHRLRESSKFEQSKLKRSNNYAQVIDRQKKNVEDEPKKNQQKMSKKNSEVEEKKNSEKISEDSKEWKVRRSPSKNSKKIKDNLKETKNEDQQFFENFQTSNKYSPKNKKRRSENEISEKNNKNSNNKGFYQKASDKYSGNINYENVGTGENIKKNADSEDGTRYARKKRNKQRRYTNEASLSHYDIWQKKTQGQHQKDRYMRGAQWHSDTKKDISRLLHSFGFAVENEDKEKIKELKKKLKGDSNSDLKSNIISKESSYENIVDLDRIKSGDGRLDAGDDKGVNRLWAVKSYENIKAYQKNPSLNKKDSTSYLTEEKTIGKKETSFNNKNLMAVKDKILNNLESHQNQASIRRLNLDVPSLQALLKNTDLNSMDQKPGFTLSSDVMDGKVKSDINQLMETRNDLSKSKVNSNKLVFKYSPNSENVMVKDKKEFRDDIDNSAKSPYIIILSQITPELKEQLLKEKRMMLEKEKPSALQNDASLKEESTSDKRNLASEQILILPVDLKKSQYNLQKTNKHSDHEYEAERDPNNESDRETEDEQLNAEKSAQFEDIGNLYKTSQNSPSEFIISWNDKSKKSVKRSKREHRKEIDENNLKVLKVPLKQSVLEDLLTKSLDRSHLNDKNIKILIHDGLQNGDTDLSSAIAALLSSENQNYGLSPEIDQNPSVRDQFVPVQPGSAVSSIASNVISAFSPKSYSQVGKPTLQHQDTDADEDNIKENNAAQDSSKDSKEQSVPFLLGPNLRCNGFGAKKKGTKFFTDDEKKVLEDANSKDNEISCKKLILTPCPPKNPTTLSSSSMSLPSTMPCPFPSVSPLPFQTGEPEGTKKPEHPINGNTKTEPPDKSKTSECSLVNCQFKITKSKKPHERLTIMIYDRINPPTDLPEPFDALAVISEILQRIQSCSNKPTCQLTEEDPDYPVNDNSDQLKGDQNQQIEMNKAKIQETGSEVPILANDNPDDDDSDDSPQNSVDSTEEGKLQTKEKATPAIDQLTVFNKDKLKPLFIDLRKIDNFMKKRSQ